MTEIILGSYLNHTTFLDYPKHLKRIGGKTVQVAHLNHPQAEWSQNPSFSSYLSWKIYQIF